MQSGKSKQANTSEGTQPTSGETPRKSKKAAIAARELDVTWAGRGVWLMKVPNYLAAAWKNGTDIGTELGTIRIGS